MFRRFGYWLYIGSQDVLDLTEIFNDQVQSTNALASFDLASFICIGRKAFEHKLTQLGIEFVASLVPQTNQVQLFFRNAAGNGVKLNFSALQAQRLSFET